MTSNDEDVRREKNQDKFDMIMLRVMTFGVFLGVIFLFIIIIRMAL